jgi:uncharacterized protein involved in type VI secretion and phage assembly
MALPAPPDGGAPSYYGVYPAIVTNIVDPSRIGRIEVRFPWLGDDGDRDVRHWATLCTPYADAEQGLEMLPEVDSQVVVAFEAGNLRRPYIVGSTWNGRASLAHDPRQTNNIRQIRTRADSRLEFDDDAAGAKVRVTMRSGHKIVLDDSAQEITIQHALGGTVRLTAASIEVTANATVDVTAPLVNVDAAVSTFSGLVKCQTLIADAMVMSPAYTPGAGNVW